MENSTETKPSRGRHKLVLTPEQEAQRIAKRRQQLVNAQARRRAKLVGALQQVERAEESNDDIVALREEIERLKASLFSEQNRAHKAIANKYEAEQKVAQLRMTLDSQQKFIDTIGRENESLNNTIESLRCDVVRFSEEAAKKPSRTSREPKSKIVPLGDRVKIIVREMTTYYNGQEKSWLENYVQLAKRWAIDAKSTATKVTNLLAVTKGVVPLETKGYYAATRFSTKLVSDDEDRVLTQAMSVLHRIASDLDQAADETASLNKKRKEDEVMRLEQAEKAFDAAFDSLDVDNRIWLISMQYTRIHKGYGAFEDLVSGIDDQNRSRWWNAKELLEKAYKERRSHLVNNIANQMKGSGRLAEELAAEGLAKFYERIPAIEEEWGDLPRRVKAAVVMGLFEKSAE